MHYKIHKGTKLHDRLFELQTAADNVDHMAHTLAKKIKREHTGKEQVEYITNSYAYAGGLEGIFFQEDEVPKDWIEIHDAQHFYRPHAVKKSMRKARIEIASLPTLGYDEIAEILSLPEEGIKSRIEPSKVLVCPIHYITEDICILRYEKWIDPKDIQVLDGMEEISEKEWVELEKQILEQ